MAKKPKWKEAAVAREMDDIWNSHEWQIKEQLMKIDWYTRAMISEMKTFGASEAMIAEYLPRRFEHLKAEVVAEHTEKYDERSKAKVG